MATTTTARDASRFHTRYSEPHSIHGTWTSPPLCHPDPVTARGYVAGLTRLAGPDAAARRSWTVSPCDGTCER